MPYKVLQVLDGVFSRLQYFAGAHVVLAWPPTISRGGCEGGGGEGEGEGGGEGGWNCTTKDLVPSSLEKLCPKPGAAHSAIP